MAMRHGRFPSVRQFVRCTASAGYSMDDIPKQIIPKVQEKLVVVHGSVHELWWKSKLKDEASTLVQVTSDLVNGFTTVFTQYGNVQNQLGHLQSEYHHTKNHNQHLKEDNSYLKVENAHAKQEVIRLKEDNSYLKAENAHAKQEVIRLEKKVAQMEKDGSDLQGQRYKEEVKNAQAQTEMKKRISDLSNENNRLNNRLLNHRRLLLTLGVSSLMSLFAIRFWTLGTSDAASQPDHDASINPVPKNVPTDTGDETSKSRRSWWPNFKWEAFFKVASGS